jgi:hypothetical protein
MEVYQVLMCLRDNAITASQFFLTLLTDPEYSLLPASLDLRSHSNEILSALDQTPKPLEADVEMSNAIETVQRRIRSEIEDLTLVEYGWHFAAIHATAAQLEDFQVKEMARKMRRMAPVLWNLLGSILDPPGQCDSMSNLMDSGEHEACGEFVDDESGSNIHLSKTQR